MAARTLNLTKRSIDALKPRPAGPYDVFDVALRGFAVRITPTGRKIYRFKYTFGGRQRVITIGEHGAPWTAETARARAQVLRGILAGGVDPAADAERRDTQLTVEELIEMWLRDGGAAAPNKRASSWAHDASRLRRHIVPLLGAKPVTALCAADIEAAQRDIAAGATAQDIRTGGRGRAIVRGGVAAARGAIVSFQSCLSWAAARDLIATNPGARVKKLAAVKRERFLSEAESLKLLRTIATMQERGALKPVFADVMRLLLLTGARKTELTALRWDEVDLTNQVLRLGTARAKNGAKIIVLSDIAAALIAGRAAGGRFVFASPRDPNAPIIGLQKAFERVRGEAGLRDVRIHDLRHSFASFAAADGASLLTIAKALGHAQTATTERYAHLDTTSVRALADRVSARLTPRTTEAA